MERVKKVDGKLMKKPIGSQWGFLTLLCYMPTFKNRSMVRCRCVCGSERTYHAGAVFRGDTKSCGCNRYQRASESRKTHGMHGTRTYRIWRNMITRCHNPNYAETQFYAGRGISVCSRWKDSFQNFLDDMGVCPDGLSIDRMDNDGNYEPGNCRWATPKEQAANRRKAKPREFHIREER
jgi:hypothetical protein